MRGVKCCGLLKGPRATGSTFGRHDRARDQQPQRASQRSQKSSFCLACARTGSGAAPFSHTRQSNGVPPSSARAEGSVQLAGHRNGVNSELMYINVSRSLLDDRAVASADLSPATVKVVPARRERRLGCRSLVDLNAPARCFVHPKIAVLHDRTSLENLLRAGVEIRVFLNAEVIRSEERRVGKECRS